MAIPDLIPIGRFEGYHTHFAGTYGSDGGQFLAVVVATLDLTAKDFARHKRWYAVLHTFDADGGHRGTEARFAGVTADGEAAVLDRAEAWRDAMVAGLGPVAWSDIAVRRFAVEVDGHTFGLVDTSFRSDEGVFYEEVSLLPNDFVFSAPWDGDFDT